MRERFLEAILQRTERKLAGPGRPGAADRLVAKVERREVPRPTSLGARGWRYQLRKAGPMLRLKGASQASWRLPPLHPLARFARDWQPSDAPRRENAEVWRFEIRIRNRPLHYRSASPLTRSLRCATAPTSPRERAGRG